MKPNKKTADKDHRADSLMERFIEGDDLAYAEIYRTYAGDIYSFGLSLHAKKEIIEDALHDIFVEIYARRKKLSSINNLKLYLLIAFKNRLFYLTKREEISTEITDRYTQFYTDADFIDAWIETESDNEREALVKRMMSELNLHQREVIYHRFVEGMSLDDIALLMNINYQSVKNLLHRSIKKLRETGATGIINIVAAGIMLLGF